MRPIYYGGLSMFFATATAVAIEYDLALLRHHMRSITLGTAEVLIFGAAYFYAIRLYRSLFDR